MVEVFCWNFVLGSWLDGCGGSGFGDLSFAGNWFLACVFAKFDVRQKNSGCFGEIATMWLRFGVGNFFWADGWMVAEVRVLGICRLREIGFCRAFLRSLMFVRTTVGVLEKLKQCG